MKTTYMVKKKKPYESMAYLLEVYKMFGRGI